MIITVDKEKAFNITPPPPPKKSSQKTREKELHFNYDQLWGAGGTIPNVTLNCESLAISP